LNGEITRRLKKDIKPTDEQKKILEAKGRGKPKTRRFSLPNQLKGRVGGEMRTSPRTSRFSKQGVVPVQLAYSLGDRVKTSNGYGTIVAIVGVQHQIALEGQQARLWEKGTTLNFYNQ
jgi:hypothetical protein